MAPGFSFPPPPPPPPKNTGSTYPDSGATNRGGYTDRGRGRGRGGSRGGRGAHNGGSNPASIPATQPPPGSYVNPHFRQAPSSHSRPSSSTQNNGVTPSQKRKRDQPPGTNPSPSWRGPSHPRPHPMKHHPAPSPSSIAPAVPSFGAPLFPSPSLPPPPPAFPSSPPSSSGSDGDDDEDEESLFPSSGSGGTLRFEHDGAVITLSSRAEIDVWFAARRARFPTKRRIAQAQHERRERWAERARIEAETSGRPAPSSTPAVEGARASRAEELRARLVEQRKAREAEVAGAAPAALGLGAYGSEDSDGGDAGEKGAVTARLPADGDVHSDSDSAPEAVSAKVVPDVQVPDRAQQQQQRQQQPCRYFALRGRCRAGAACTYAHMEGAGNQAPRAAGRKDKERITLFQRLLEQEQSAENKLAVMAIKYLGEKGFFRPKEDGEGREASGATMEGV